MNINWIIAAVLFLVSISLLWKLSSGPLKKEYGVKMWNHWGSRLFYWQGVIYAATLMTILFMFILKWVNILSF